MAAYVDAVMVPSKPERKTLAHRAAVGLRKSVSWRQVGAVLLCHCSTNPSQSTRSLVKGAISPRPRVSRMLGMQSGVPGRPGGVLFRQSRGLKQQRRRL
jgi:hypothetical protein